MPLLFLFVIYLFATAQIFAENLVFTTAQPHQKTSFGILEITSNPSHAKIFLNGKETGYRTPAILKNVKTGLNTIEITLPNYMFAKRQITVVADTTISMSFKLISLSDTVHVIGDLKLGILSLPEQPLNTPYLVDNKQVYTKEVILNEGKHQVIWEGGNRYTSLDTIIHIYSGKLTTFQFVPKRLYGNLLVSAHPDDADIFLNNRLVTKSKLEIELATGVFKIRVECNGFYSQEQIVNIIPNERLSVDITLQEIPDRDNDGYLDSVDRCPNEYGLYDGCPRQNRQDALVRYKDVFFSNLRKQPLIIFINTIGYMNRFPTNFDFKQFLSFFNDGKIFFNNHKSLTFLNSAMCSFHGIFFAFELGQWHSGLEYKKNNYRPLNISTTSDEYYVVYDTTANIKPRILLPSTNISVGFNLIIKRFNVSYSLGYQWEDILLYDLVTVNNYERYQHGDFQNEYNRYTGPRTSVTFNNNWWLNKLRVEYDFLSNVKSTPALYFSMSISAGSKKKTGWNTLKFGIVYKFYPLLNKNGKTGNPETLGEPIHEQELSDDYN